jgi:hypothetical protein
MHVQHALRMSPTAVCLLRLNFLTGQERYKHVFTFARVRRLAVLVNRPSYYGPALLPGQDSARHEYMAIHLDRGSRVVAPGRAQHDQPSLEFWDDDWRADPASLQT